MPWTSLTNLKYLGIYIDDHLSWHDHITYIWDKISKCINIMIKVKRCLGNQCLTSIYASLDFIESASERGPLPRSKHMIEDLE